MGLGRFLGLLALGVIVLMLVLIWLFPSNEDFRVENPYWNGIKDMDGHSVMPLRSLSDLPASPRGATLILIPYLNFSTQELGQLNSFVTQGATLVLADDYGHGNQVLEYLGLKARFSGQMLLDPLVNYKNEWLPRVLPLKSDILTDGVESLVLNHATCLTGVEATDVLAASSLLSFLDLNGNGVRDKGEPNGPLAVAAQHNLGSGRVILISDPSLFINSMEAMADNSRFIQNIIAASPIVLVDQSHLPPTNLSQAKGLLAQVRGSLVGSAGAFGLVAVALAIVLRPIWHESVPRLHGGKEGAK